MDELSHWVLSRFYVQVEQWSLRPVYKSGTVSDNDVQYVSVQIGQFTISSLPGSWMVSMKTEFITDGLL